jgi:hypothetical protein
MYSIDCYIRTNNQGIRTAVTAILPDKNDPRVNIYDYRLKEDVDEEGVGFLHAMIRFDLKSDRDSILNSIKGLNGVINACEDGSFVRPHICGGDDEPCVIEDGGVYK